MGSQRMSFSATGKSFTRNGKPYYLISGEIHYFRLDPSLWEKHLRLLKESGANTTSTYIPWDWHEYEEGKFDFSGETDRARDLKTYILLCQQAGLDLIVKPGPYILAEYEAHGLPGWMLNRCSRAALATDEHGMVISPDIISYMSEEFLHFTRLWYDTIMPIIAEHQHGRGGPITMMQVCNEVGVFQWLSGRVDYNPCVIDLYRRFLRDMYGSVEQLNTRYQTCYSSFAAAVPPRGVITTKSEYARYVDFHLFYRHYFARYLDTLAKSIRSYGIDLQLTHNVPGWIFGNAAELPMLIGTYAEVLKDHQEFLFGMDHIPEFASFRNAHSDLAANKILAALQPHGPVWAAEFQSGTREHQVKNDPVDMELFYFASLAHGLRGFNYYAFSQGVNPPGKGVFGKTFYFQTPLDVSANESELYSVAQTFAGFINKHQDELLASEPKANICAGLYKPYFNTELTTSQLLKERRIHVETLGLYLDPRYVREEVFFNGLLRGLQTININYDVHDLETAALDELLRYTQLWVTTTESMDAVTQAALADYVKAGGHLVIYPAIPTLDNYLNPCTVLRDALQLRVTKSDSPNKVRAFGIDDVYTAMREKQTFEVTDEEVVATTAAGGVCGVRKRAGKGWVVALGFVFGYSTDDHLRLYEHILGLDAIERDVDVSDPDIQFVLRRGKKHSFLFLLNYHNQRKTFTAMGRRHTLRPFGYKVVRLAAVA
jgi:beta-galactosidase